MPFPYEEWNQIHSFPYGEVLYDLDISPDGRLLSTSFGAPNGEQSLRVYEIESLLQEDVSPVHQFDFGQAVPESFVFSPDGKYLFGSSYFTGISNIFRYELATEDLQAVSNAEAGFFRPVPREDGSLIVFRYSRNFLFWLGNRKEVSRTTNLAGRVTGGRTAGRNDYQRGPVFRFRQYRAAVNFSGS
jgi:Tol biopolymer transport system component